MFERFFSRNRKQPKIPKEMLRQAHPQIRQKKKILIKRRYLLDNKGDRAMLLEELPSIETKMRQPIQKQKTSSKKIIIKNRPRKENSFERMLDENKLLQQIIGYQKEKNLELESIIGEIGDKGSSSIQQNEPTKQEIQPNPNNEEAMEINFYMVATNEELEKKLKVRREEGNVILNVNDVHIVINNKSKSHFPTVGWA